MTATLEENMRISKSINLDFDNLDYMELSVVSVDKESHLPAGDAR